MISVVVSIIGDMISFEVSVIEDMISFRLTVIEDMISLGASVSYWSHDNVGIADMISLKYLSLETW